MVRRADLSRWDALVIMSGDGLLFEVTLTLLDLFLITGEIQVTVEIIDVL